MTSTSPKGEQDNHSKVGGEELEPKVKVAAERVDPACLDTFKQIKIRRKFRWIMCKIIEDGSIVVEKEGQRSDGINELRAALPLTEPRFIFYDHEYTTSDGRKPSKLFFLSWTPRSSVPWLKMAYTAGKAIFRDQIEGVFDTLARHQDELEAAFGIEVEDEEDSDIEL